MTRSRNRSRLLTTVAVSMLTSTVLALPSSPVFAAEPAADTTPPTVTLDAETTPSDWEWHNSDEVRVTAVASDTESPIHDLYFKDGKTGTIWVLTPSQLSHSASFSRVFTEEGVRTLEAYGRDKAGNLSNTTKLTLRIDRTAPTITVTTPKTIEQGAAVALNYFCSDTLSDIARCSGEHPDGTRLDTSRTGTFGVLLAARDKADNTTQQLFEYTVRPSADKLPTVGYALNPGLPSSGWYNRPVDLTLTGAFPLGVGSVHYRATGAIGGSRGDAGSTAVHRFDTEGVTDFEVYARDAEGNLSDPKHLTLRIDRTPPTVSGAADHDRAASVRHVKQEEQVAFAPYCNDALSGVASCTATGLLGGKLDTRLPGEHVLALRAVDRAGNVATGEYRYFVDAGSLVAPKPKISGTAKVGKRLTARAGTWKPSGVKLSYRWYRNGKAIKGATKPKYKLNRKDRGKRITVKVTGGKPGYRTVTVISAKTKRVR